MFQAMNGILGKLMMSHRYKWTGAKIEWNTVWLFYWLQEGLVIIMITTEADNDKRLIWVLLGWELVLNIYNKQEHLLYCLVIYNCGSIFSIICTVLGNVSKRALITSATTVHVLNNQKRIYFQMFWHQWHTREIHWFFLKYHILHQTLALPIDCIMLYMLHLK